MQWLSSRDGSVESFVALHDAKLIQMNRPFAGNVGRILSEKDALRGAEVASLLQIDHLFKKQIDQCSSGERQVVQVAHALLEQPTALVLVEPFRHLDRFRREHLQMLLHRITAHGVRVAYTERAKEAHGETDFPYISSKGQPDLKLCNVSFRHPLQSAYAVEDVTYRVSGPGLTVCIGANGSGKSTLLELMARAVRPLYGKVGKGERAVYLSAEPDFGPFPEAPQRRVAQLKSVLTSETSVLLLDEPSVDLTDDERRAFAAALSKKAETARVVCATHDPYLIKEASDVLCLASGRVVYSGTLSAFQERSTLWSHTSSLS